MARRSITLDFDEIRRQAEGYYALPEEARARVVYSPYSPQAIAGLQVAVYTMCGGGFLGKFAAEQPADFYVDSRVGSLPYPVEQIEQAVRALRAIAEGAGLNPHAMPPLLPFHAAGVF